MVAFPLLSRGIRHYEDWPSECRAPLCPKDVTSRLGTLNQRRPLLRDLPLHGMDVITWDALSGVFLDVFTQENIA
ncbi:hypothetical protein RRG08_063673 [Elysia crispata]|uniref:Uncharacterized protein n=1 Tax=Elysia crispata TaxID=231223 RepID=A0AAE0ZAB6_9GAST|nr:hypothetical protein RRG08_063673 [Elysia crispata]